MKKKGIFALALIFVLCIAVLTACGTKDGEVTTTAEAEEVTGTTKNLSDLISEDAKITEVSVLEDAVCSRVFESDGNEYLFRVFRVKNVSDKTLDISFSDKAFDRDNNEVGVFSGGVYAVNPEETAVIICAPVEKCEIDHYEYNDPRDAISIEESSFTSYTDKVSFTKTDIENGVKITAVNNSDNLGSVTATVLFYKEDKLVDAQSTDLVNISNAANDYKLSKGMQSEETSVTSKNAFDRTEVICRAVLETSAN